MFKKYALTILALISSPVLDLSAKKPESIYDIKVTKADVMPDSAVSFAAAGFTLAVANILAKSALSDYDSHNKYHELGIFALNTAMIGTLLTAIVRDHKKESSDQRYDTAGFLTGALVGTVATTLPQLGAMIGGIPTAIAGGVTGATIGTAAKMLNKKCKIPADEFAEFGCKVGLMTGGVIGGAAGLTISGGLATAALYKNAIDIRQLIDPKDVE